MSIANGCSSETVPSGSVAVTTATYSPSGSRAPALVPSQPTVCAPGTELRREHRRDGDAGTLDRHLHRCGLREREAEA